MTSDVAARHDFGGKDEEGNGQQGGLVDTPDHLLTIDQVRNGRIPDFFAYHAGQAQQQQHFKTKEQQRNCAQENEKNQHGISFRAPRLTNGQ